MCEKNAINMRLLADTVVIESGAILENMCSWCQFEEKLSIQYFESIILFKLTSYVPHISYPSEFNMGWMEWMPVCYQHY